MQERNEWECEHGGYGDGYVGIEEGMRWGDHARVIFRGTCTCFAWHSLAASSVGVARDEARDCRSSKLP